MPTPVPPLGPATSDSLRTNSGAILFERLADFAGPACNAPEPAPTNAEARLQHCDEVASALCNTLHVTPISDSAGALMHDRCPMFAAGGWETSPVSEIAVVNRMKSRGLWRQLFARHFGKPRSVPSADSPAAWRSLYEAELVEQRLQHGQIRLLEHARVVV